MVGLLLIFCHVSGNFISNLHLGRGRENKENERNIEDGVRDVSYSGNRRGRGGSGRPGRGGRGGGRGLGPRTFANRNDPSSTSSSPHNYNRSIDTWTGNDEQQQTVQEPKMGKLFLKF